LPEFPGGTRVPSLPIGEFEAKYQPGTHGSTQCFLDQAHGERFARPDAALQGI
jgi:hypothetical protein